MMSSWDGIDEFVAVANSGNFSRAAMATGTSTTHMSRAVMRLEAKVQTQLFVRTTRTVRLTEAGVEFLEQCRKIIADRDEVIGRISSHGEPEGELRITCSTFIGEKFVAPIVRRFVAVYPKVHITMTLTNRVVDLVAEGIDLAVRTGAMSDSRLIGTRIGSRSLITCASPHYLSQADYPKKIGDLDVHSCLIGTADQWHFKHRGKHLAYRPKGRWRCDNGSVVLDAALEDMGICQLPDFYLMPHIRTGALKVLLNQYQPDHQSICAICPQRRHLPSKLEYLIENLKSELPSRLCNGPI
jgi:DNA-binding transcriptional LysR family regulator